MWFLIVMGFVAGFVDAVAGGGGLISLPAVLSLGLSPQHALGTNKAIGICTSAASTLRYGRLGLLDRKTAYFGLAAGILSVGGAWVATLLDPHVLRPIVLVGLIAVGFYTLVKRKFGERDENRSVSRSSLLLCIVGVIGFYDGFFGPGTGTFLMMALVLLGGQSLLHASANARLLNFASNLGAILLYGSLGYVEFRLVLPGSIAAFVGGTLGASWAAKHGSKGIRPVFVAVTWLLIAKVAYDTWRMYF